MKQYNMRSKSMKLGSIGVTRKHHILNDFSDQISGIIKEMLMLTGTTAGAFALLSALSASPSHALPQNGAVVGGSATVSQPNTTTLNINQTSGNAIINWQGFNIGANESVKYIQPSNSSIALNRVTGVDPTYIYGLLSGNGQVWVINPNGLLVGPGATVQTGSFLASTMNITNDNFMSGKYMLSNTPNSQATIVNQGNIQAANGGYVMLVAPSVTNSGSIVANMGTVHLASGDAVTLSINGGNLINVAVSGDVAANALGVTNTGHITADGGQVVMTARVAGDILKNVVNNEGIIEAKSIIEKNGLIILDGGDHGITANSGTLDASGRNIGETGGTVKMLGDKVGLFAGSIVDVSGAVGGGTALIGGNLHGAGQEKNSTMTYVDKDASIKADALVNGDGGKVVVWSDDATRFYGSISAQGGTQGGDGGNVEVSGKQQLAYAGTVDTTAPKGKTGSLLLDPNDLYVGADPGGGTDVSTGPFQTAGGPADYFVTAGTFAANTNYTLQAGHDVIFNTGVAFGSQAGNTVSVTATNNIASTGHTVSTNGGALTLNSATMSLGAINTGAGLLTINNSGAASQSGVFSGSGGLTKNGAGTLTLSQLNTYSGATNVNAGTLSVTVNGGLGSTASGTTVATGAILALDGSGGNITYGTPEAVTLAGGTLRNVAGTNSFAGAVTLTAPSAIDSTSVGEKLTLTGGITNGGNLVTFSGAGDTTVSTTKITGSGGLTKTGAGTLILSAANDYTGATNINDGTLRLSGGSAIADAGAVVLANTSGAVTGGIATGTTVPFNVTFNGAGNTTVSTTKITGSGGLTKNGTGTLLLSAINDYTGITTINAGTLQLSGGDAIADAGAVVLANIAGTKLDLNNSSETIGSLSGGGPLGGNVTLGSGTLTVGDTTSLSFGGVISGAGGLTKQGTGTLTLTNTNTYDGVTAVNTGTLKVTANGGLGSAVGGTTVAGGALLVLDGTGGNIIYSTAEPVTLNGGTLGNVAGTNSFAGAVTLGAASAIDSTLKSALTLTGGITNGGYLVTFSGDGNSTVVSGAKIQGSNSLTKITGSGGLTKTDIGTLLLSGANDYSGVTTINGGTLQLSGGSAASNAVVLANVAGAVLDLNGTNETISSLSGGGVKGGNVTLGTGTLTVGDATDASFGGIISGAGGLTKQGAGTLTLTNTNTYGGTTNITAGTLKVTANGGLGSAAGGTTVASGAVLTLDGTGGDINYNTLEAITLNGGTFNNLKGANNFAGTVTVGTGTGTINLTADSLTLSGAVEGSTGGGSLAVIGSGTLTLGNTVGKTTPIGGLTTANGVKMNINGGMVNTVGAQSYHDDVTIGSGNAALTTSNKDVTFDNTVTLNKDLTITSGIGAVTFTGTVDGTKNVDGSSNLTVNSSGLTTLTSKVGHTISLSSVQIGTGTTGSTIINGGEVSTSGAQTYNNAVTIGTDTNLTSTGSGSITVAGTLDGGHDLTLKSVAGNIFINGVVGGTTSLNNITLNAGQAITEGSAGSMVTPGLLTTTSTSGQTLVGSGNNSVSIFNANNSITSSAASKSAGGSISTNSGSGDIILTNSATPLTITGINQTGDKLIITNTGAITSKAITSNDTGILAVKGATTITAAGQPITLTNANDFTGAVTVTGAATQINDKKDLTVVMNTTGPTTLSAGGNMNLSGISTGPVIATAANKVTLSDPSASVLTLTGDTIVGTMNNSTPLDLTTTSNQVGISVALTGNLPFLTFVPNINSNVKFLGTYNGGVVIGSDLEFHHSTIDLRALITSSTAIKEGEMDNMLLQANYSGFFNPVTRESLIDVQSFYKAPGIMPDLKDK